jgi:hypothetical protein
MALADDCFGLQIFLQSEDPAFPTNSRLFEPAEASKRIALEEFARLRDVA